MVKYWYIACWNVRQQPVKNCQVMNRLLITLGSRVFRMPVKCKINTKVFHLTPVNSGKSITFAKINDHYLDIKKIKE